jgi:general secretion pathway protein I
MRCCSCKSCSRDKNYFLKERCSPGKNRGFTLLEVLIALAILALSAAALLRQTQLQVKQQFELEMKTYAMWVADDTLSALSAQPQWPPLGRNEKQITFHEQEWLISTDVQSTSNPLLRKIEVGVNLVSANEPGRALVSFTTFRGRY